MIVLSNDQWMVKLPSRVGGLDVVPSSYSDSILSVYSMGNTGEMRLWIPVLRLGQEFVRKQHEELPPTSFISMVPLYEVSRRRCEIGECHHLREGTGAGTGTWSAALHPSTT